LRDEGHQVIAESAPNDALAVARQWLPDVIVAPTPCLHAWASGRTEGLEEILPNSSFLVTAEASENLAPCLQWLGRGHEVLLKPVIHSAELVVAVEAAIRLPSRPKRPGEAESIPLPLRRGEL